MRHLTALLFPVLLWACTVTPGPVPVPPDPVPVDAGPPPAPDAGDDAGQDDCAAVEAKLRELDCRDGLGKPLWVSSLGESFAARCRKDVAKMGWDLRCIQTITSCSQLPAAATGELCADGGAP